MLPAGGSCDGFAEDEMAEEGGRETSDSVIQSPLFRGSYMDAEKEREEDKRGRPGVD